MLTCCARCLPANCGFLKRYFQRINGFLHFIWVRWHLFGACLSSGSLLRYNELSWIVADGFYSDYKGTSMKWRQLCPKAKRLSPPREYNFLAFPTKSTYTWSSEPGGGDSHQNRQFVHPWWESCKYSNRNSFSGHVHRNPKVGFTKCI